MVHFILTEIPKYRSELSEEFSPAFAPFFGFAGYV